MPEIEYVTIANHVEAVNGLLYVSGGGWTDHWRGSPPAGKPHPPSNLGIGVSVIVGWAETNRPHHLTMTIEHEDGGEPLAQVDADLQVGRPAALAPGSDQRKVLAVNANIQFPRPGGYRVKAQLGDISQKTCSFRVHDQPMPQG